MFQINLVPPPLAFKFRAHLCCVTCLDFIQKKKLLVTSSTDGSVRLWTYQGKYIGKRILVDLLHFYLAIMIFYSRYYSIIHLVSRYVWPKITVESWTSNQGIQENTPRYPACSFAWHYGQLRDIRVTKMEVLILLCFGFDQCGGGGGDDNDKYRYK